MKTVFIYKLSSTVGQYRIWCRANGRARLMQSMAQLDERRYNAALRLFRHLTIHTKLGHVRLIAGNLIYSASTAISEFVGTVPGCKGFPAVIGKRRAL